MTTPISPLAYIHKSGAGTLGEITKLSVKDKEELKQYAREEMAVLGVAVTPEAPKA